MDPVVQYFMAIRLNKSDELSGLLRDDPTLVNRISRDGFNGLHLACKYGFEDIAETLLDHGIRFDETDQKYGRNFLHWASMQGHNGIILMVMRGYSNELSSMDRTDSEGYTALMLAAKSGRVETVRILMAAGARTDTKVQKAGVESTVLDMVKKTSELARILSNTTPHAESNDFAQSNAGGSCVDSLTWGFTSVIGLSISKVANNKPKHIAHGWMQSPHVPGTSGTYRAHIVDVIVKLNKDSRELQQELDVRQRLFDHLCSVSSTTASDAAEMVAAAFSETINETSTASTSLATSGVDLSGAAHASDSCTHETLALCKPHQCSDYFVRALHPQLITVPNQPDIWHAILLEKGIIDVHHLYDSMCQKATYSRLHDTRWKLLLIQELCKVCRQMLAAGMVWYDLKPSNFIVFPAPQVHSECIDSSTSAGVSSSGSTVTTAGLGTKAYKWLQQSHWEADTFAIKATDLSSVFAAGDPIEKAHISCTAKFLCPAVAAALMDATVTTIVAEPAHMMWSLGMTMLQLLHTENKTFYARFEVGHAEQVYSFLRQDSEILQRKVHEYVGELVSSLADLLEADRDSISCLLKGILMVNDVERMGMEAVCERLHSLYS